MSFCPNCGEKVEDGVKFCSNCGTRLQENSNLETQVTTNASSAIVKRSAPKVTMFFGLILMLLSFVDFFSDPPLFTIILSGFIIIAAIYCLIRAYRLSGFSIVALIVAIICIILGSQQASEHGLLVIPSKYKENRETYVATHEVSSPNKEETKPQTYVQPTPKPIVNEQKEELTTSSTVDGSLKEFLDSYEAFIDEYVAFMKKYMNNPDNTLSMLSEYMEFMQRYADFAEAVAAYDSKSMSTSDYKYYIEVTTRCATKMLEVYY